MIRIGRWMEATEGRPGPDPDERHGPLLHPSPGGEGGEEGLEGLSRGQTVQETPGHRQEAAGGDSAIVCIIYFLWKALIIYR